MSRKTSSKNGLTVGAPVIFWTYITHQEREGTIYAFSDAGPVAILVDPKHTPGGITSVIIHRAADEITLLGL